jgi:hypothetical protein
MCTFFCETGFAATNSTGPAAAGPTCFFFGGMSSLGIVGQALVFCITPSAGLLPELGIILLTLGRKDVRYPTKLLLFSYLKLGIGITLFLHRSRSVDY